MLLTITTTHSPATDLGYLLHKHPEHVQSFELSFGQAHVFYPEADAHRCTAALLLDIDPIGLVRGRRGPSGERGIMTNIIGLVKTKSKNCCIMEAAGWLTIPIKR